MLMIEGCWTLASDPCDRLKKARIMINRDARYSPNAPTYARGV